MDIHLSSWFSHVSFKYFLYSQIFEHFGVMTKIIPRNTTSPTSKSVVFSTVADGHTSEEILMSIRVRERYLSF